MLLRNKDSIVWLVIQYFIQNTKRWKEKQTIFNFREPKMYQQNKNLFASKPFCHEWNSVSTLLLPESLVIMTSHNKGHSLSLPRDT